MSQSFYDGFYLKQVIWPNSSDKKFRCLDNQEKSRHLSAVNKLESLSAKSSFKGLREPVINHRLGWGREFEGRGVGRISWFSR